MKIAPLTPQIYVSGDEGRPFMFGKSVGPGCVAIPVATRPLLPIGAHKTKAVFPWTEACIARTYYNICMYAPLIDACAGGGSGTTPETTPAFRKKGERDTRLSG